MKNGLNFSAFKPKRTEGLILGEPRCCKPALCALQQRDHLEFETVLQFVGNISHSSNFHMCKISTQGHLSLLTGVQGVALNPSVRLEPFQKLSTVPAEQFVFAKIFCHLKLLSGREKQVLKIYIVLRAHSKLYVLRPLNAVQ